METHQPLPDDIRFVAGIERNDLNTTARLLRYTAAKTLLERQVNCLADTPEQRPCYKCSPLRLPDGERLCDRLRALNGTIIEYD